jgi:hypothetical protein
MRQRFVMRMYRMSPSNPPVMRANNAADMVFICLLRLGMRLLYRSAGLVLVDPLPVPDQVLLSTHGGKEWLWWALCGHPVGVVGFLVASAALCGLPAFFVALSPAFFE